VPLRQLRGADLMPRAGGIGDLTLSLAGRERIGWLHLWPHARPWELRDPQPALRCVPGIDDVGQRLLSAWQAANASQPVRSPSPAFEPATTPTVTTATA